MSIPRSETGEVMHPSGATRPLAVVLTFPQPEDTGHAFPTSTCPGSQTVTRLVAPHPDEDDAMHALHFITVLLDDPRSTLTRKQIASASGELSGLLVDAARDVLAEDPSCAVLDLPGRTAVAAMRVIVQRGLIREEWDT